MMARSAMVVPNQVVTFTFKFENNENDVEVLGVQLAHPQPQFKIVETKYDFDAPVKKHLKRNEIVENAIVVKFVASNIGQYEMPIVCTFIKESAKEAKYESNEKKKQEVVFVREMVVYVESIPTKHVFEKSPYTNTNDKTWTKASIFKKSLDGRPRETCFKIPKPLKTLFPLQLNEDRLEKAVFDTDKKNELRQVLIATKAVLDEGINKNNYIDFFHNLLWWEETKTIMNLRKFNMEKVTLEFRADKHFWLKVPGLAEKRPSLLTGDRLYIRPVDHMDILYEAIIDQISDNAVLLSKIDLSFEDYYSPAALFNIRFITSRVPMERMHMAVDCVYRAEHGNRIFPKGGKKIQTRSITKFYNNLIARNKEQKSAVEHTRIVSGTSGQAPYIVFGPPGTGKTITIVEAIIQIVAANPSARVLVCTESNMAADNIASAILKYKGALKNIDRLILRANSINREWTSLPTDLHPVSNGTSKTTFYIVKKLFAASHRILVTTLMHCHKFGGEDGSGRMKITHLFIDEAAQAKEPAALVPITRLLAPNGQVVLAGDPKQLGPVCMSTDAGKYGLDRSLLERLWLTYHDLYRTGDSDYITTLMENFRSHPDILCIPNMLFYAEKQLQARAKLDPLSNDRILDGPGEERAIVFHSVNSREQRMGKSPSFFNDKELQMVKIYVTKLIEDHKVKTDDIGIITPYIRQMYKIKEWLMLNKLKKYDAIEVGTVESFQGKEKRVILVSTVRANCRLLDFDAKYDLGFLVEDKRFNVALTRAKAKLIIIGNNACLERDEKWRKYMNKCTELKTYYGQDCDQLKRTSELLAFVAKTGFDKCRLTEAIKKARLG